MEFSHRCFDAWIEDAWIDGRRFGETSIFKRLASSSSRHDLTVMIEAFPVGILLGCWASRKKNPQGTTRLARILTSEIVAVDAVPGARPASRIDRHHVSNAAKLLPTAETSRDRFSLAPSQDGKPPKGAESPSELGYGNVAPGLATHGGITMDHALQIATVSMPALRECGFPDSEGKRNGVRDVAGRMMLAALALRMLALQVEHGYDLRSGCLLVPEREPSIELIGRLGKTAASWPLIAMDTERLLADAISAGADHGLSWAAQKIQLAVSDVQRACRRTSRSRGMSMPIASLLSMSGWAHGALRRSRRCSCSPTAASQRRAHEHDPPLRSARREPTRLSCRAWNALAAHRGSKGATANVLEPAQQHMGASAACGEAPTHAKPRGVPGAILLAVRGLSSYPLITRRYRPTPAGMVNRNRFVWPIWRDPLQLPVVRMLLSMPWLYELDRAEHGDQESGGRSGSFGQSPPPSHVVERWRKRLEAQLRAHGVVAMFSAPRVRRGDDDEAFGWGAPRFLDETPSSVP